MVAYKEKLAQLMLELKCTAERRFASIDCKTGMVYQIPFDGRHVYFGQTGRCVNAGLLEHKNSLKHKTYSHVNCHCSQHGCVPLAMTPLSFQFTAISSLEESLRHIILVGLCWEWGASRC